MAAIQSRLPAPPSLKVTEKETTKPNITTKLRKPNFITSTILRPATTQTTTSPIAPSSKPTQSTEQEALKTQSKSLLKKPSSYKNISLQTTQITQTTQVTQTNPPVTTKIVNGPPAAKRIVNGPSAVINDPSAAKRVVNGPPAAKRVVNGPPATTQDTSDISDTSSQTSSNNSSNSADGNKSAKFSNVKSRVGSFENIKHKPKSSDVKICSEKKDFSNVKSRIGSLENANHAPKGGEVKIFSEKTDYSKAKSRVGSFDNVKHETKGGNVKIFSSKPDFKSVHSRIGSLDNIDYVPKGGDKVIFNDKLDFSSVRSRVGSLDNINHTPKGGDITIFDSKLQLSEVKSRVGSLDNINHTPKGGDITVFDSKLQLPEVKSRVGSLDNINHTPKGGDIKIFNQKLKFKEYATPKIITRSVSSNSSSFVADDDRSSLVYSPVSSLALDEAPEEVNDPPQEQCDIQTPSVEVLSPIIENFGIEEEYEEEVEVEESSIPVYMNEAELSFEVHDSFQQGKVLNEETNKHTEFYSGKETNFNHQDQNLSGKETYNQLHEIVCEEEAEEIYENDDHDNDGEFNSQTESTYIRESTIYTMNESSLNDTDLSFEVNVLRKSILLSNVTDRNSIVEDVNLKPLKEYEIPPENESELPKEPELTIAQQRAYDESWI
ncbi:hypothetical protein RclHR1_01160015 [Rhizophagus clarus]|uniref:Microtubule-associated protein tau isoform X1 n=1 Tax=Rhizophagus clarus TaxID=94130 RepID=A0A2Z6QJV5_9GLOM|nr:hypothetical protein RclHR1_01160015 [Rhizophagus clarus]GET01396.1 microtubule-associated protein tau isoform X1 [Rhizophagus clarus]